MKKLMTATELIAALQDLVTRHGDLPVGSGGAVNTGWIEPVRDINIEVINDQNGDFSKEGTAIKMFNLKLSENSYETL